MVLVKPYNDAIILSRTASGLSTLFLLKSLTELKKYQKNLFDEIKKKKLSVPQTQSKEEVVNN